MMWSNYSNDNGEFKKFNEINIIDNKFSNGIELVKSLNMLIKSITSKSKTEKDKCIYMVN